MGKKPLRYLGLKKYLKDKHKIQGRWTTINGAFQVALDIPEVFDDAKAREAIKLLGQDPDADLTCVYCAEPAASWDHLNNNVVDGWFSGYGSRIFNLVPCCRGCNESKSGNPWRDYVMNHERLTGVDREEVARVLDTFSKRTDPPRFAWPAIKRDSPELAGEYEKLLSELRGVLRRGDEVAEKLRQKMHEKAGTSPQARRRRRSPTKRRAG